jgi:hypothetical protein
MGDENGRVMIVVSLVFCINRNYVSMIRLFVYILDGNCAARLGITFSQHLSILIYLINFPFRSHIFTNDPSPC